MLVCYHSRESGNPENIVGPGIKLAHTGFRIKCGMTFFGFSQNEAATLGDGSSRASYNPENGTGINVIINMIIANHAIAFLFVSRG